MKNLSFFQHKQMLRMAMFASLLLTQFLIYSITNEATAQVSGTVFKDFNGDGTKQANEPLVSGITVNVYNPSNTLCSSGVTSGNSAPNYTTTNSGAGCGSASVRIEFIIPTAGVCVNSGIDFSALSGNVYGTSVQFANGNSTGINFAINNPSDYNTGTTTTNAYIPCYVNGDPLVSGGTSGVDAWFVGFPYGTTSDPSSTPPMPPQKLDGTTIGAVWGTAYSKHAQKVFTSAFLKRHVGMGKMGSGGIYLLTPTTTSFSVTQFYDMDANGHRTRASAPAYGQSSSFTISVDNKTATYLGSNDALTGLPSGFGVIGTNTERGLDSDKTKPSYDPAAFDQIGKVGLGDIEMSDDGKFLFVINLYSRKLFRLTLDDAANPTAVSAVTSYDLPAVSCTYGVLRPFAVKYYKGSVYVGAVCTAELSDANGFGKKEDMQAYVFQLNNPTSSASFTASPVISFPLTYRKFKAKDWRTWNRDASNVDEYSQPILSNIDFSDRGDLIMTFMDRGGHQWGQDNYSFLANSGTTNAIAINGDILIAGINCNTGNYTLESNGSFVSSNGQTLTGGVGNQQGPGTGGNDDTNNGEFFSGDNFQNFHYETSVGSVAIVPGSGELIAVLMDPYTFTSGGTVRLSTNDGTRVTGSEYQLYRTFGVDGFGKANGLGEISLSKICSPIEIGNRVWKDTDKDGIQDAGELGVDGVVFELYEGTTATGTPAQTVTSATVNGEKGTWFFTNLKPGQDYVIKVKTALGAGALATCTAYSPLSAGTILTDNNTSTGTIALKTGNAGENNHSFDVGVVEGATCIKPIISQVTVTPATCKMDGGGNNNAKIVFKASGGDKYGISKGAAYTGPAYAAATAIAAGGGELLNITNESSKWTIRVFNADNSCFKDSTVILDCNRCVVLCPNISILIGEQTDSGEKVVIMPLDPNSPKPPCDLPNTGGDGITIDAVNKIAYIGSPSSNPIKAYSFASAQFLSPITPSSGTNSYDITLSADRKYLLRGATGAGAVEKIRISDGTVVVSRATSFFTNDGEKKIWGVAVQGAKVYITTGYNDFNTIGKSTIQVMDSTFSNPQLVVTRNDGKIYVGITVDKDGTLWATVDGYGAGDLIEHLAADGSLIKSYPITSSNNENTKRPFDIEFGPDGNLYVATFYGDCVSKLTLDSPSNANFGVVSTYISFVSSVRSKNLAFVCGDVLCPCAVPKRLVKVTDPTCAVAGKIELTSVTGGDKYGISKGATYTGPAYASATANGTLPKIVKNNISNTADSIYTVRVFASDICYIDTTVIVKAAPVKPTITQQKGSPFCRTADTTYTIKFMATGGTVTTVPSFAVTGDSIANIPIATASVKVLVTSAGGCKDSITVTAPVCLVPCVKPNAGTDAAVVCQPTTTSKLTAVTTGGTWSAQSGNPATAVIDASGNITGLSAAGTYKFIYSVMGGGQTCTDTAQVVVNAKPNIADGTATICAGGMVDLISKITSYTTLLSPVWTVATAGGTAVTTPTSVKPTSTTTYVLVAQNAAGCKDTANIIVTVNPKPNAGKDSTMTCIAVGGAGSTANSLQLVATPTGGTWAAKAGNPTGATVNTTGLVSVTYTTAKGKSFDFIYTKDGCADTVKVIVPDCTIPCLKPSIGGPIPESQTLCSGDAAVLYTFADPDAGANDFQWYSYTNSNKTVGTAITGATGVFTPTTAQLPPADGNVYYYAMIATSKAGPASCSDTIWAAMTVKNCAKGSIGDYVWKDTNDNGINDEPTSAGVKGVKVQLLNNIGEIIVNTALSGSQQVPAVTTTATGTVFGSFNSTNDSLKLKIEYSGLSSVPTMAHLHTGATGTNGGVAVAFIGFPATTSGVYNAKLKLTTTQKASLLANLLYVNIHTSTNGGGELRSQLVLCDTTDAAGKYSFDNLPSGQYQVKILTNSLPVSCLISSMQDKGTDDTKDSDFNPSTGLSQLVTIDITKLTTDILRNNPTVDVALYSPKGSLGDYVWKDTNDNGINDEPTSAGVKGVIVELYKKGTSTGIKDTTDVNGKYLFVISDSASYQVKIVSGLPVNCVISTKQSVLTGGGTDANNSDFNPTTGLSTPVTVNPLNPAKKDVLTVDAALYTPCVKPTAGPDQNLTCNGVTIPSITNLVDAATGQKWKVLSVQSGTTVFVTTPAGAVSGMSKPGEYKFVLQTQSDSLNCRDTMSVFVPNCGCVSKVTALAPNITVCKDDTFPTLKVMLIGTGSADWYKTSSGSVAVATNTLSYKPMGNVTATDSFFVQGKSADETCPASSKRIKIVITAITCIDTVDLTLKKMISKKLAKVGDEITYTVKVWNQSNKVATGVAVSDSLNVGVQYISSVASRGSYDIGTKTWTIGNMAANGDTVTLTIKVKVLAEGVWFNTAQISKTDQIDKDSTPGNNKDNEDDIDRQCFSVPIQLCLGQGAEVQVPSNYTGVVWKDGQGDVVESNGGKVTLTKAGTYTFTATNGSCPTGGCCPVIVEEINCCPAEICIPFTITKKKK